MWSTSTGHYPSGSGGGGGGGLLSPQEQAQHQHHAAAMAHIPVPPHPHHPSAAAAGGGPHAQAHTPAHTPIPPISTIIQDQQQRYAQQQHMPHGSVPHSQGHQTWVGQPRRAAAAPFSFLSRSEVFLSYCQAASVIFNCCQCQYYHGDAN